MSAYLTIPRVLIVLSIVCLANLCYAQRSYQRAEGDVERYLEDARNAYENFELDQAESDLDRAIRLMIGLMRTLLVRMCSSMGIVVYAKRNSSGQRTLPTRDRGGSAVEPDRDGKPEYGAIVRKWLGRGRGGLVAATMTDGR